MSIKNYHITLTMTRSNLLVNSDESLTSSSLDILFAHLCKGDRGNGISRIVLSSTVGLVKTYTIYYDDGGSTQFSVTDGAQGAAGPNEVSTATVTAMTGLLKGNGMNVETAIAGTDYQGVISDLAAIRSNALAGKTASDSLDGHTVAKSVPSDAVFTDTVYDDTALAGRVGTLEGKTRLSDYTDDLGSTPTHSHQTYQSQIDALKSMGRFLAIWNCVTGKPVTEPTSLPYAYHTGDYYRVGQVATGNTHTIVMSGDDCNGNAYSVTFSIANAVTTQYTTIQSLITALYDAGHVAHSGTCPATGTITDHETQEVRTLGYVAADGTNGLLLQDSITSAIGTVLPGGTASISDTISGGTANHKPSGDSYTGAASTVVETADVKTGWVYYYDGSAWMAQSGGAEQTVVDVQAEGTSVLSSSTGIANVTRESLSVYSKSETDTLLSDKADDDEVVKTITQSLTTGEKTQARTNIGAVAEPATEGTDGQVLTTDGNGGRTWATVQSGGMGVSYADNTITFFPTSGATYDPTTHTISL